MTGYPENSVRALLAESGITGPDTDELAGRLSALEQYVDDTPPEPSPQLAALMAGKATAAVVAPFSRRRGRVLVASLVAVGAVGAGGIAAAANELPAPAQDLVAELSERYLPFSLPRPAAPTVEEAPPAEGGPDPVLPPPSPSWGLDDDESPRHDRLADPWTTAPADPMPTPKRSKKPEPSSSPTPSEDATEVPEEPVVPTEPTEDPSVPDADEVTGDGTTSEEGAGGTDSTTGTGSADGTGTTGSTDGSGGTGTTTASDGETSGGQTSGTGATAGGEPKTSPRTSSDPSPSAGRRRSDPPPKAEPHSRGKAKPRGTAVWSDL